MESGEQSGVRVLELIKPREIPRELMAQKTELSQEKFYSWAEQAGDGSDAWAFLLRDELGAPAAFVLFQYNDFYSCVGTDTFVVHKKYRGTLRVKDYMKQLAAGVVSFAQMMDARAVHLPTNHPEVFKRVLPYPLRQSEVVLTLDLKEN